MGRRAAPQPLRLPRSHGDASSPASAPATGGAGAPATSTSTSSSASVSVASAGSPASAAAARTQTDPDPAAADHGPSSAGPAKPTQASPRISPFTSRFNTRRPQTSRGASDDHIANRQKLRDEHPPPPPSAGRADASYSSSNAPLHNRSTSSTTPASPGATTATSSRLHKAPTEHRKFSKSKGGFFHFAKSSKGNNQLPSSNSLQAEHKTKRSLSRGRDESQTRGDAASNELPVQPVPSHPSVSELSVSSSADPDASSTPRKNKQKPFGLLGRSRSIRDKGSQGSREHAVPPIPVSADPAGHPGGADSTEPKTAPPTGPGHSFREMMDSTVRNHSEDRAPSRGGAGGGNTLKPGRREGNRREHSREKEPRMREKESHLGDKTQHHRDRDHKGSQSHLRENGHGGSGFLSGLRSSSTRAADMISKGLFGKSNTRTNLASVGEPVIDDEHYELKVINLPLVEQTRKTRISKRLETSRDKTEFWMPAFPWRAIDYLNYKGCEVEGLYRVPGSGPQIKRWQRKFDEDFDVDLFEVNDLYDINIVGSMLKAWLRELPDELFPKAAQERVMRECAGAETVPQLLVDELSNLSPFNYYLLFAITCHLSLLLAHSEKNKMDFRNLCICFQPCMKIDAFCFRFLVCEWRDCWKGCKNEAQYIEEEYKLFDQPPPRELAEMQRPGSADATDEQALKMNRVAVESDDDFHSAKASQRSRERNESSSSSSSKHSRQDTNGGKASRKKLLPLAISNDSMASSESSRSTHGEPHEPREQREPPRATAQMRQLSPIPPLSPIGF